MKNLIATIFAMCALTSKADWIEIANLGFEIRGVEFTSPTVGTCAGEEGIYKTLDGGLSWLEITNFENASDQTTYGQCTFYAVSQKNGYFYVAGQDTVTTKSIIIGESNVTGNWRVVYEGPVSTKLTDFFYKPSVMYAVGDSDLLVQSAHSNLEIWTVDDIGLSENWNCIHGYPSSSILYVGGNQKLGHFQNGNWYETLSQPISDIYRAKSNYGLAVNDSAIFYGNYYTSQKQYFPHPLLANRIEAENDVNDGWSVIATDNGILYSDECTYWGKYPSTNGYHVLDMSLIGAVGFAVCNDGSVLYASNYFTDYAPFVDVSGPVGGCVDSMLNYAVVGPSYASYDWFVNNTFVSSSNYLDSAFNSVGTYSIKLIGNNNGILDSAVFNLNIVEIPDTSVLTNITDSTVCKNENTSIIISNPELNVEYLLFNLTLGTILSTGISTSGNNLVLNTGPLLDSCQLLIKAKVPLTDCEVYLPDTFNVIVENPIADFQSVLVNAKIGESVYINNLSSNANTFEWNFLDSDASISLSNDENPILFYSLEGEKSIELIATAEHGCSDTTMKTALFVYDDWDLYQSCWAHKLDDVLAEGDAHSIEHFGNNGDLKIITRGLYTEFPTKKGWSSGFGSDQSMYEARFIATYSEKGVFKRAGYFRREAPFNLNLDPPFISDIYISDSNNVYVAGKAVDNFYYFSPGGDSTYVQLPASVAGFIVKLDSNGSFKWIVQMHSGVDFSDPKITLDQYENLYYFGPFGMQSSYILMPNDSVWHQPSSPSSVGGAIKFSSDGIVQWLCGIATDQPSLITSKNGFESTDNGNLFIAGEFKQYLNVVGADSIILNQSEIENNSGRTAYLLKIDSTGNPVWINLARSLNDNSTSFDRSVELAIDHSNNMVHWATDIDVGSIITSSSPFGIVTSEFLPDDTISTSGLYIGKYNYDGQIISYSTVNGLPYAHPITWDIAINQESSSFISGYFESNVDSAYIKSSNGDSLFFNAKDSSFWVLRNNNQGAPEKLFYDCGTHPYNDYSFSEPKSLSTGNNNSATVFGELHLTNFEPYAIVANDTLINTFNSFGVLAHFDSCGCSSQYITGSIVSGDSTFCLGDSMNLAFEVSPSVPIVNGNKYYLSLVQSGQNLMDGFILDSMETIAVADTFNTIIPITGISSGNYKLIIWSSNIFSYGELFNVSIAENPICNLLYNNVELYTSCVDTVSITEWYLNSSYLASLNDTIYQVTDTGYYEVSIIDTNNCYLQLDYYVNSYNTFDTIVVVQCNSLTSPSGDYIYNVSGIYNDTIPNFIGGDSIITINFTLQPSYSSIMFVQSCDEYMSPGGNLLTSSGIYYDSLSSVEGCDSIVSIYYTLLPEYNDTVYEASCVMYVNYLGDTIYNSGVYTDSLLSNDGCDSIVILNLTVAPPPSIDINSSGMELWTTSSGNYQWFDCDANTIIAGEIDSVFSALIIGNYAVIVDDGICVDTSSCVFVSDLSNSISSDNFISIYPNPNNGHFKISSNGMFEYDIRDAKGDLISFGIGSDEIELDLSYLSDGIYFIRLIQAEKISFRLIVIE